jgi:hypothetical protein
MSDQAYKKLHLALSSHDIQASIRDYSQRLGCKPQVIVKDEYALWRTSSLNLSVRQDITTPAGQLRHLGFEDAQALEFSQDTDCNGILWERFSAKQQRDEITELWPDAID